MCRKRNTALVRYTGPNGMLLMMNPETATPWVIPELLLFFKWIDSGNRYNKRPVRSVNNGKWFGCVATMDIIKWGKGRVGGV
jgi:hypothetical protein